MKDLCLMSFLLVVSDMMILATKVVFCQEWIAHNNEILGNRDSTGNLRSLLRYTQKNGFDLKLFHTNYTFYEEIVHLDPSWIKLFAIYSFLNYEKYDWVIFIDSNEQLVQFDVIESLINPFANSYLMLSSNNSHLNSGFQIWKNTLDNRELIESWLFLCKEGEDSIRWFNNEPPYEVGTFPFLLKKKEKDLNFYHMKLFPETFFHQQQVGFNNPMLDRFDIEVVNSINFSNLEPLLFELTPFHFAHYLSLPVPRYFFKLTIKDHENEDYQFVAYFSWDDRNINYLTIKRENLESVNAVCLDQVKNPSSCKYFLSRMNDQFQELRTQYDYYKGLEIVELYKRRYPAWELLTEDQKPFFQSFPEVQQPPNFFDRPKVIVTIFAGRKRYLELLIKYWKIALQLNIIQEIHLWDYVREKPPGEINEDRPYLYSLMNPREGIYVKTRSTNRRLYSDYYDYYANHGKYYPIDIIIKCDDDIVFIDIYKLPYFLSLHKKRRSKEDDEQSGRHHAILLANTINHPVAAHYQQSIWNIFPSDQVGYFEFPPNNSLGQLWESGQTADRIHEYFLNHWERIIRPSIESDEDSYAPEILGPITTRFPINFFATQASNFLKLQDIGLDDEFFLTVTLPQYRILENYMVSNFIVSHMAYGPQNKGMNITKNVEKYHLLYEEYIHKYHNSFQLKS